MSRRTVLAWLLLGFCAGMIVTISWRVDQVSRSFPADDAQVVPVTPVEPQPVLPTQPQQDVKPSATEAAVTSRADPKSRFAEDPVAALQRLAASCSFWSQRAADQNARAFRDRSCREMRAYAARTGQRAPTIESGIKRAPVKQPRARSQPLPLYVRECSEHSRGSIDYRRCRARESRRLKEQCQSHRQKERWSEAASWCAAYESYQVID